MHSPWLYRLLIALGAVVAAVALVWMRDEVLAAQVSVAHPATVTILVPRVTLAAGTPLEPQEFRSLTLPLAAAPPGAYTAAAVVTGAIARQTLWAGEPVVAGMVYPSAAQAALSLRLKPGMRAMDVPVGPGSGVGGLLNVGDRVDVIAVQNGAAGRATVLITDVPVLAVVGGASGTQAVSATSAAGTYTSVILQLTPRQAAALSLAQVAGPINLVLRNPLDPSSPSPTLTTSALTGGIQ